MKRAELRWRHEWKYWIRWSDYRRIQARLAAVTTLDSHAGSSGDYHIRSLYFDSIGGDSAFDKLAGLDNRARFRIRIYDQSDAVVRLEAKHRQGFRVSKESTRIDRHEVSALMACRAQPDAQAHPLLNRLRFAVLRGLLRPVVVVDYLREAYLHSLGNVRITFDKHLGSGTWNTDIFDAGLPIRPIQGEGDLIMEVKYDGFLPTFIRRLLPAQLGAPISISKYILCRPRLNAWEAIR